MGEIQATWTETFTAKDKQDSWSIKDVRKWAGKVRITGSETTGGMKE